MPIDIDKISFSLSSQTNVNATRDHIRLKQAYDSHIKSIIGCACSPFNPKIAKKFVPSKIIDKNISIKMY